MMPKGVEHEGLEVAIQKGQIAQIPMMPKGVEHPFGATLWCTSDSSADSYDAERR